LARQNLSLSLYLSLSILTSSISNSTNMAPIKPNFGVYTPLVTFFDEAEGIDLKSTLAHAKRMAEGGVAGPVLQGSNGEAPHLDHGERKILVRAVRDHLNQLGYKDYS
jgi:2-keto-3-deoxy-L-rhamnonate aldolase